MEPTMWLKVLVAFVFSVSSCRPASEEHSVPTSCLLENGGCEHFCNEDDNGQKLNCSCADGYFLDVDGLSCLAKDAVPCGRQQVHFAPRVVNGMMCPKGHCPWQALLTRNHSFTCGAIVLSDQWILTAAHCVWGHNNNNHIYHVVVGEHDQMIEEETEQKRRVVKILMHQNYNTTSYDSDLAMLKLHRPVNLGLYVVPICLPARNSTFDQTLSTIPDSIMSGWGRLAQFGPQARFLQRLVLPRVPLQECRLHTNLNITRNMLCAGRRTGGQGTCGGDGGGPLVTRYKKTWFLTGVMSWGKGCAAENTYDIYVNVGNFLDWIQNIMSTG